MSKELSDQQGKDEQILIDQHSGRSKVPEEAEPGKKSRDGKFSKLFRTTEGPEQYEKAVYDHPSDNYEPVWFDLFAKNLLEDERMRQSIDYKGKVLAEKYGWGQEHLDRLHGDQRTMATLVQIGLHDAFDDPIFDDLDRGIIKAAQDSAYANLDDMAKDPGLEPPMWIHHAYPLRSRTRSSC